MTERNLSERYRLEGRIGQGGMAVVYAGVDTVLRRRVAIKVLRPQLAADADFVARFYSEAQHAAKLSHPNIVNIYDVGREGEDYFIVMELVDGATLAELIEKGRLPEPVAIDFATQICEALAYAHRQGLLHRDIKPANILVTKDDVVKLSDFGIARAVTTQTMTVTQPGMIMGSVYYLSPEQAQGHELHETSDLYSLGIVFYQMLTAKLPYTGESPVTVALKHVSSPIPAVDEDDPSISPALAAIVRKLMQKNPADRFSSAVEVARALREARERPAETAPFDVASRNGATDAGHAGPRTIPNPKPRPSKFPDRPSSVAPDVRLERAGGISGARIVLAVVALVAAIVAGFFFTYKPGVLFPPKPLVLARLSGLKVSEAEAKLDSLGLKYALVPVASESVAENRVVKQDPIAGASVPRSTVVQLSVSTGLPTMQMLDVRQMSSDDAQRFLRGQRLVAKIVSVYDDAKAGTVLSQKPAGGSTVHIRTAVTLVVSQGPKPVSVPEIVSLPLDAARAALQKRQLRLTISERDPSDQIAANTIASQDPAPGSALPPGSSVAVIVSSGPQPVAVPDFSGRQVDEATSALQAAGLEVRIVYLEDASAPPASVMGQDPPSGKQIPKGSSVTLNVAVDGLVPDVAGKSIAEARAILMRDGYRIGNTAYTQEGPEGTVARTEPAAKSPEHAGATITLYVSGVSPDNPQ